MSGNNKIAAGIAAAVTAAALMIGGTMSYLTDYDTAANDFTVGKVDIEIDEPSWDPDDNTSITPGQVINKDPLVSNTGSNEAFVYLEVAVPMQKLVTADASGNRVEAAAVELFSFTADKTWTLMDSFVKGTDKIYLYSYNKILKPAEKTTELFKTMNFVNAVEGQIDGKTFEVPVRAYAIQTANTGGDGETVPAQAKNAFNTYLNQNKGQAGQAAAR